MERAVIVICKVDAWEGWSETDLSCELRELVRSAGGRVDGEMVCKPRGINPRDYIGSGKLLELRDETLKREADLVVFNDDLSPGQQRNIEAVLDTKVIDRTQLILDIFARTARSREGKIQVELAQLVYLLPRLAGKGILLSRLGGGIGTRGPGEQKLEADRRKIRDRISRLSRELEDVRTQREALRARRRRNELPTVVLVGYTNAGKSTLLNTLTGAGITARDRLFSTLDPTTRLFQNKGGQKLLLSDTVGFLNKLPAHLIEAFKATLEEIAEADVLVHVLDISHPKALEQAAAVYETLDEIGAGNKHVITALNKVDKIENLKVVARAGKDFPDPVPISALKGTGVDMLVQKVFDKIEEGFFRVEKTIPHDKLKLLNRIYECGRIIESMPCPEGVRVTAMVPLTLKKMLDNS